MTLRRREVKRLLRRHGLTQGDVARRAGVTPQLVCNVIAGRYRSANVWNTIKAMLQERAAAPPPAPPETRVAEPEPGLVA